MKTSVYSLFRLYAGFAVFLLFIVSLSLHGAYGQKSQINKIAAANLLTETKPPPPNYSDDLLDLQFEFPCTSYGGERGIETDGEYIYTSGVWSSYFYQYSLQGALLDSFQITGVSYVRHMTYDGIYFYGSGNHTIVEMDFENRVLINSVSTKEPSWAIAYDCGQDAFWTNGGGYVFLLDRNGNAIDYFQFTNTLNISGLAWMGNEEGSGLWGYHQNYGANKIMLYLYNVETGSILKELDMLEILSLPASGYYLEGLFMHQNLVEGYWTIGGMVRNTCIWGVEYGEAEIYDVDMALTTITSPNSHIGLPYEDSLMVRIKNEGINQASDVEVSYRINMQNWVYSTIPGPIPPGGFVEFVFPESIQFSVYEDYLIESCVAVPGDENADNDCRVKTITIKESDLCVDGLYTSGVAFDDGLISWKLSNIEVYIEAGSIPTWYHNYQCMTHLLGAGDLVLTVKAGYTDTWFDVWIDFNDDLNFTDDELVLDDAICEIDNTYYDFTIHFPDSIARGIHVLRFRTNWDEPVTDPCVTYAYGNCCDFMASFENPQIQINPDHFDFTIQPRATLTDELTISNTGSKDLTFQLEIHDVSLNMWDVQFAHELAGLGPQNAIAWDGEYFYIASFTSADIHIFDAAGNYIGSVQLPEKLTIRDFTWDGNYLWACNGSSTIYQIDIQTPAIVSSLSVPLYPRSIAYDHDQDAFWMGTWSSTLVLINKSGAIVGGYAMAEQVFGLDYDNFLEDEKYLWLLGYDATGFRYFQFDVAAGMLTGLEHYIGEDFGYEYTSTGLFVEIDIIAGTTTIGGLLGSEPPQFFGYELYGGSGENWLSVDPVSGTVPPGGSATVLVMVDGTGLGPAYYENLLRIESNDPVNPEIDIPVTLDVITAIDKYESQTFELYPNPTAIEVFVHSSESIQIVRIFSILGENVMINNATGNSTRLDISALKPGIFLVEVETKKGLEVRKLVVE